MGTQTQALRQSSSRPGAQSRSGGVPERQAEKMAAALGWFSLGLGFTELLAPGFIAGLTGTSNKKVIRSYGVREVISGMGILAQPRAAGPVWSRVVGDVLDIAALAKALGSTNSELAETHRGRTLGAIAAVAGVAVLDIVCARELSDAGEDGGKADTSRAEASVIVNKSPEECYRFWRDFENFPRFMIYLNTVRITSDTRSHWIAKAPAHGRIEWDAEIEQDTPNQRIAWHSLPGSDVYNAGSVDFEPAPGGRGTIVRVQIDYGQWHGHPGAAASALAKLIGKDVEQMVHKDLRRFKQFIETGEVITTEGQSAGRTSGSTWLDNIAR